ncbi:MAG: DUF2087 domain-containing protein [Candidatus Saccharibacteria bacterium]
MNCSLCSFLDSNGLIKQWPSKRANQLEVIKYLAGKFPVGSTYSDKEINQKLKDLHTFGDWAILRRELCDLGYFERDRNGTIYIRVERI